MKSGPRSQDELLDHAVELLESSSRRVARSKRDIPMDEQCFQRTRAAIASSLKTLQLSAAADSN
jgi:hypothetical protein